MKRSKVFILIICLSFILFSKSYCQKKEVENSNKQTIQKLVPDSMECDVQSIYLHRADGKAGIEVLCNGIKEVFSMETKKAIQEYSVLLPADADVSSSCEA